MLNSTIHKHPATDADEIHRNAYNAAFCELGLRWRWDINTYRDLLHMSGEKDRLRFYLETRQPHLLKAYDVKFLIDAIQMVKARCYDVMIACGARGGPYVNWVETQSTELGI
jgi:hypothetical protein